MPCGHLGAERRELDWRRTLALESLQMICGGVRPAILPLAHDGRKGRPGPRPRVEIEMMMMTMMCSGGRSLPMSDRVQIDERDSNCCRCGGWTGKAIFIHIVLMLIYNYTDQRMEVSHND